MNCTKCNVQMPENAIVCRNCGEIIEAYRNTEDKAEYKENEKQFSDYINNEALTLGYQKKIRALREEINSLNNTKTTVLCVLMLTAFIALVCFIAFLSGNASTNSVIAVLVSFTVGFSCILFAVRSYKYYSFIISDKTAKINRFLQAIEDLNLPDNEEKQNETDEVFVF